MRSARLLVAVLPVLVAGILTVLTAAPTLGAPVSPTVPIPVRGAPGCPSGTTPVCGSDGVDYRNSCEAKRARVQIRHTGPCTITERSRR
ncbi:Kazal-type serine protease inhibitor family protein [Nocardia sp. BMG111209]|uniref:Kazal-type serine protease inhibitor family protein n=1 Tax=Nocardia sp. BMG111209 TaxID=1160137 RepID=UPI00036510BB|nr:Kazal-type serine protease inhibitor family protein [Nocardia sp. BMG111209]